MMGDIPISSDRKIAIIPQLIEPIISIKIAGFVATNSYSMLKRISIKVISGPFLKRIKSDQN
jgi:hypothetical protein